MPARTSSRVAKASAAALASQRGNGGVSKAPQPKRKSSAAAAATAPKNQRAAALVTRAFAPVAAAPAPSFHSNLPSQLPGVGAAGAVRARCRGGGRAVGGSTGVGNVGNGGNAAAAEQKLLAFKQQIERSMQQVREKRLSGEKASPRRGLLFSRGKISKKKKKSSPSPFSSFLSTSSSHLLLLPRINPSWMSFPSRKHTHAHTYMKLATAVKKPEKLSRKLLHAFEAEAGDETADEMLRGVKEMLRSSRAAAAAAADAYERDDRALSAAAAAASASAGGGARDPEAEALRSSGARRELLGLEREAEKAISTVRATRASFGVIN